MERKVADTSPYINGYIIDYGDEIYTLERPEDPTIYFNKDSGGTYHTTTQGEMLDAIANQKYGEPLYWHNIYAYNLDVIDNPLERLPGGLLIFLPDQNQFT